MSTPQSSAAFAALAAELHAEPDEKVTADTIVRRLADLIPEADCVSLTIRVRGGAHETLAATHPVAEAPDALQYEIEEGPCLQVADGDAWLHSGDVRSDVRWPRWGPQVADAGVGSLLSVQLHDAHRSRGALNVYATATGRFADRDTIDGALVYAVHAASALESARLATNLQTALSSRHTIGMAQGIVMERYGLDEPKSFELLRRLSSTSERKLRDVAAHIVETRALPEVEGRGEGGGAGPCG